MGGGHEIRQTCPRHRRGGEGGSEADPRHRPRSRGRGDFLASSGGAPQTPGDQEGRAGAARRLQRHHQERGDRGDAPAARHRSGAGGRLSRPARAGLPRRFQPLAGALAQAAGRQIGGSGAIRRASPDRRAGDGDRGLQGARILVSQGAAGDAARRDVRGAAHDPRRRQARQIRPRRRGGGEGRGVGGGGGEPVRGFRRSQARQPQSLPALHDFDPSAGGVAQARLWGAGDDAGSATAL